MVNDIGALTLGLSDRRERPTTLTVCRTAASFLICIRLSVFARHGKSMGVLFPPEGGPFS
jgi:hypothetical protein